MMERLTYAIIVLDIIALFMTAGWIFYSVYQGIGFIELFYNYSYALIVMFSYVLNIYKIVEKIHYD